MMFEPIRNMLRMEGHRLGKCSFGRIMFRFRKDYAGVAALEFALIAPFLLVLYMGAIEFSDALTVNRRVTLFTSAAADLVAQTETVNDDALGNVYDLAKAILYPYDTSKVSLVITSVEADEDNETTVDWSWSKIGAGDAPAPHAEGASFTLPGEGKLTHAFSSVIVVEVFYQYTSPVLWFIPDAITMSDTYYLRPRKSLKVEKTD